MIGRRARALSQEQLRILQRLAQLRAATAPQLQGLLDFLRDSVPQATYSRLQRLVRDGYVRMDLVRRERGRFSPAFYALASKGVATVRREAQRSLLLSRPPQRILEYLLLRNEVFARARGDGWLIASPVLASPDALTRYRQVFNDWALDAKARELAEVQARSWSPMDVAQVRRDAEQLSAFLPKALTFDFLVKMDRSGRARDVVLLLIDDPRRSVTRQGASSVLPSVSPLRSLTDRRTRQPYTLPGLRLLLRDTLSEYDVGTLTLARASPRLRAWRRLIVEKYGETGGQQLLATDTLFPDVWARRIGVVPVPAAPTPKEGQP